MFMYILLASISLITLDHCKCQMGHDIIHSSGWFDTPDNFHQANLKPEFSQLDTEPLSLPESSRAPDLEYQQSTCQLVKVIHLLRHPGCRIKAVSSLACSGICPSYVQISSSKSYKHERSCTCCRQTRLRRDTFVLDCPSLTPPYRQVTTHTPVGCLCRSCTEKENLKPQELVEATSGST